jgi:solute carrier family 35, member F5
VSYSDSTRKPDPLSVEPGVFSPKNPLLGDAFALVSALFYALYVILLKVKIKSESRVDMQLFFGFVGLFNILLCWPAGVFLHLTGLEPFALPSTRKMWAGVLINVSSEFQQDLLAPYSPDPADGNYLVK